VELLIDEVKGRAAATLVLAHGAGGPMRSRFLAVMAAGLSSRGVRMVRFEFPYMAEKRRAPDREPVLLDTWRRVVAELGGGDGLFIGGKSMGGRMASMVADELGVRGLVCLGYPFHPPATPERLRTKHLLELRTPALFVQGERDPFGTRSEVESYGLPESIELAWMRDGDHSFKPRVSSGTTEAGNLDAAQNAVQAFIGRIDG
jgi:predicted alpha/beta-hydrolase family hydrolase